MNHKSLKVFCEFVFISSLVFACKSADKNKSIGELQSVSDAQNRDGCKGLVQHKWQKQFFQTVENGALHFRIGVSNPNNSAKPIGDIIFFPGFADRIDNHQPLFQEWTNRGFRVIAFEYPGHGESCGSKNSIDSYSIADLARFARHAEGVTFEDKSRPLFVSGWSTGGLVASRMLQDAASLGEFSRKVTGMVLFAPGVGVHALIGEWGKVTEKTLTRNSNPPHLGPILPASPLLSPFFATNLLKNSLVASNSGFPVDIPILIFVGGDTSDRYVNSVKLKDWFKNQVTVKRSKAFAVQCKDAFHELDNEPTPTGDTVRKIAGEFMASARSGVTFDWSSLRGSTSDCFRY